MHEIKWKVVPQVFVHCLGVLEVFMRFFWSSWPLSWSSQDNGNGPPLYEGFYSTSFFSQNSFWTCILFKDFGGPQVLNSWCKTYPSNYMIYCLCLRLVINVVVLCTVGEFLHSIQSKVSVNVPWVHEICWHEGMVCWEVERLWLMLLYVSPIDVGHPRRFKSHVLKNYS